MPTLVRKLPEPIRKIIGDLSDTEKVLVGLAAAAGRPDVLMASGHEARWELTLYVNGAGPRSSAAIEIVRRLCDTELTGQLRADRVRRGRAPGGRRPRQHPGAPHAGQAQSFAAPLRGRRPGRTSSACARPSTSGPSPVRPGRRDPSRRRRHERHTEHTRRRAGAGRAPPARRLPRGGAARDRQRRRRRSGRRRAGPGARLHPDQRRPSLPGDRGEHGRGRRDGLGVRRDPVRELPARLVPRGRA